MKRTIIIRDPEPPKPPAGKVRCGLTLLLAVAADAFQVLVPPLWLLPDVGMVVALLLLWGWRWEIFAVVVPEVVPGLELFPTWTLFAVYFVATRRAK